MFSEPTFKPVMMSLRTALAYSFNSRSVVSVARVCSGFRPAILPSAAFNTSSAISASKNKDGKTKKPSTIDKLLDELEDEDDDDDDEQPKSSKSKSAGKVQSDEVGLPDTPAARFIDHFHLAKKKEGKASSGRTRVSAHLGSITYAEAKALVDVDVFWNECLKMVEDLKNDFVQHLTVRSSTALDDLPVDLEGDSYPLHEIASLSKKDPKRIIIECSTFPQAASSIMKTLQNSGMNLNPQQEGTRIYVPMPKVTKEFREGLAKGARTKFNDTKERIRSVQNKWLSAIANDELKGHAPKEHFMLAKDIIMAIAEHHIQDADKVLITKQNDLLNK